MRKILAVCLVMMLGIMMPAVAADDSTATEPNLNNGQKWRIGYYESGPFGNYDATFGSIIKALTQKGWLENMNEFPYDGNSRIMWQWLISHDTGKYIEFVNDGFYTFNNNNNMRQQTKMTLIDRLNQRKDINLMIVMGTAAGQDVANDLHSVPTMVYSVSDAIKSGIIYSAEDSGRDHLWANVVPNRYKRQVELFHDIFVFKKLGVVYENSVNGRSMAAMDDVEALAQERGFEIVRSFYDDSIVNKEEWHKGLLEANKKVAEQADAVYLVLRTKQQIERTTELLTPFFDKKIPTFAQFAKEVPRGALLSISTANYDTSGAFNAEVITKVFNGAKPRQLSQIFISSPSIEINLEVADRIGYMPPFTILLTADTVYSKIESGEVK